MDVEMLVEGPRAHAYGVSRRSAEGVRAISWGSQSALLDSLFDDRPALLDYDTGALRVVGGFMYAVAAGHIQSRRDELSNPSR